MSSRLQQLGARVLGSAPSLAPRAVSRFESPGNEALAAGIAVENPTVAEPPAQPVAPDPPSRPSAERSESQPRSQPVITPERSQIRAQPERKMSSASNPKPATTPQRPSSDNVRTEPSVAPTQSPPTPPSVEKVTIVEKPPVPPHRDSPQERFPAPPPRDTDADIVRKRELASELRRLREWISSEKPPAAQSDRAAPKSSAPRSRTVPTISVPTPAPVPRAPATFVVPPPAPPPVEINIGTILVRATTSEPKGAPSARPNHAEGLARYLARRSAGLP